MEAAVYLARQYPRDEVKAEAKMLRQCTRAEFAEKAIYRYPRGGETIKGPSVNLARQLGRCWGNMVSGVRVLGVDDEWVQLQGFAFDLESNCRTTQEHRFRKRIQRKGGWKATDDERELRELLGRQGAILERNCILRLLPSDVVDATKEACTRTLLDAAKNMIRKDKASTIKALLVAFQLLNVTKDMIEKRIEAPIDDITADQLAELRECYTAISEGHAQRSEFFDVATPKPAAQAGDAHLDLSRATPVASPEHGKDRKTIVVEAVPEAKATASKETEKRAVEPTPDGELFAARPSPKRTKAVADDPSVEPLHTAQRDKLRELAARDKTTARALAEKVQEMYGKANVNALTVGEADELIAAWEDGELWS
jgi:hypothetical protein